MLAVCKAISIKTKSKTIDRLFPLLFGYLTHHEQVVQVVFGSVGSAQLSYTMIKLPPQI